jgi:hypothetical protein
MLRTKLSTLSPFVTSISFNRIRKIEKKLQKPTTISVGCGTDFKVVRVEIQMDSKTVKDVEYGSEVLLLLPYTIQQSTTDDSYGLELNTKPINQFLKQRYTFHIPTNDQPKSVLEAVPKLEVTFATSYI